MAPNHLGSTDHSITLRHLANSGWNSSNLEPPVVAVSARLVRCVGSEWDRISSSRLAPGQGGISPHSSRHQARRWRMSGLSSYIVDAVVLERRSPTALAREDGITRRWIHKLVKRFKEGGYSALEPRSRRPHSCSHQISSDVQAKVLRLRQELAAAGHDASPETIAHHLIDQVNKVPSAATMWRILKRNGLITPQPHKRPKSSFIRFEAKLPNETWQLDSTPWQLSDDSPVEILNFLDDRSRVALASKALPTVKADDVVRVFYSASSSFGLPASLLSDNAAVFTGKSRRGKVLLELELERLGILFKHSTPYHPQTCGKVERFHLTLKRFLRRQAGAESLAHLQLQLDAFRVYYNQQRPHSSARGHTPFQAFQARVKAGPSPTALTLQYRVRRDKLDGGGKVTIRYLGRLRHLYVSYKHKREPVTLLVAGSRIKVVAQDVSILRKLTLDAARGYQQVGQQARSTMS